MILLQKLWKLRSVSLIMSKKTWIMHTKWKNRNDIFILSSCVSNNKSNVSRAEKPKQIPLVVAVYNLSMGCVDCSNKMLTSYVVECKRLKKWCKKYFLHLLNISPSNAHIIPKLNGYEKSALQFRDELVELMELIISNFAVVKKSLKTGRLSGLMLHVVFLCISHMFGILPHAKKLSKWLFGFRQILDVFHNLVWVYFWTL